MAEEVQRVLDGMVVPLKNLLDRGILSPNEVESIVNRRRESEYLLRRSHVRKADYLRYLEAEMALERLRQLRMKRKLRNNKSRKSKQQEAEQHNNNKAAGGSNNQGDYHIIQFVHVLFGRATLKFKSDISLVLQHANFAKGVGSWKHLGQIYMRALQYHPHNVGLWIEAASLEYFGVAQDNANNKPLFKRHLSTRRLGGSIQNARILMQRALRINPTSKELWIQYFCLELHHVQKLTGRRTILQQHDDDDDNHDEEEEQPLLFDATPLLKVIYTNAIRAIPDCIHFQIQFLQSCHMFPQTDQIQQIIRQSMAQHFKSRPDAWIARAKFAASTAGHTQKTKTKQKEQESDDKDENDDDNNENDSEEEEEESDDDDEDDDDESDEDDDDDDDDDEESEDDDDEDETEQQAVVGFRIQPARNDDNDDDETSDEPVRKKQRQGNPVLDLLQEAVSTLPTLEMYLEAIRYVRRDYATSNMKRGECIDFCQDLFSQYQKDKTTLTGALALEYADFLHKDLDKIHSALDVLMEAWLRETKFSFTSTTRKESPYLISIGLHLVLLFMELHQQQEITTKEEKESTNYLESAIEKLKELLKTIPLSHVHYPRIQLELFGAILLQQQQDKQDVKKEQTVILQLHNHLEQILHLSTGLTEQQQQQHDEILPEPIFQLSSCAQACVAYIVHLNQHSDEDFGLKQVYRLVDLVLGRSQWMSTARGSLEWMIEWFDKAIEILTPSSSSLMDKRRRQSLKRLYAKGIQLCVECGANHVADSLKTRRDNQLYYSSL